MPKRHSGSLLLEIGIVLVIVILLVTLSVPHHVAVRRFLLRAEVEKLYALFHYLQQRALTMQQDQVLVFDRATNSYSTNDHKERFTGGVVFGVLPGVEGPPSNPVGQIPRPVTFKNERAVFYADGTIASGTVYLIDSKSKQLYALTAPISQISYVRIYRYCKNSWACLE